MVIIIVGSGQVVVPLKSPVRTLGGNPSSSSVAATIEMPQQHHEYTTVPASSATRTSASLNTSPVVIRTQTGSLSANPQQIHGNNTTITIQQQQMAQQQTHVQQPQTHVQQQTYQHHQVHRNMQQQHVVQQHHIAPQQHRYIQHNTSAVQQQQQQQPPQSRQHQQQMSHSSASNQQMSSGTPPKSLITTPILDHTGARKSRDFDFDYSVER